MTFLSRREKSVGENMTIGNEKVDDHLSRWCFAPENRIIEELYTLHGQRNASVGMSCARVMTTNWQQYPNYLLDYVIHLL